MSTLRSLTALAVIIVGLNLTCLSHQARAEITLEVSRATSPLLQCRFCEESDANAAQQCNPTTEKNYCACEIGRKAPLRVFVRDGTTVSWTEFDQYAQKKLQELKKTLTKKHRRLSKSARKLKIQKELKELTAKLTRLKKELESQCYSQDLDRGDGGGEGIEFLGEAGGYRSYLLSLPFENSFALAISTNGAIAGGGYGKLDTIPHRSRFAVGVALADQPRVTFVPAIWRKGKVIQACAADKCPPGFFLSDINNHGLAVGTQIGPDAAKPQAWSFNSDDKKLTLLPSSAGLPACVGSVNDQGKMVGSLGCSQSLDFQASDLIPRVAVWNNGQLSPVDDQAIIASYDSALRPIVLDAVKAHLTENQDWNECSAAEIAGTTLVGGPKRKSIPAVLALKVNEPGDILGSVVESSIEWSYSGQCFSGDFNLTGPSANFLIDTAGAIRFSPPSGINGSILLGTTMNDSAVAIGLGKNPLSENFELRPIAFSFRNVLSKWQFVDVFPRVDEVIVPTDINNRGDIVGDLQESFSVDKASAFAKGAGPVIDLNSVLPKNSEWKLEVATGVNECGEIVGRAYNGKLQRSRAFLLSPKGCR